MASVGTIALYFALLTTIYAIVTAWWGVRQNQPNYIASSRGATLSSFLMLVIASFVLLHALVTSNFHFSYVADYTSKDLSLLYKVSAFWAGQSGSLLLWLLVIAGLALVVQYRKGYREQHADLKIVGVLNLMKLFFLFLLVTISSPFQTLSKIPFDGMGLNPMLQSFGMVVHPPVLFLGYSGFIVPFAIVLVELWFKHKNPQWADKSRPWVLFSWLLLSAGMVTGGNWAYTELGWGGYWAWDPVENASLFPWLTSTALLHTLIMQRNQKGMKVWNYLLIAITFILTIFGTFLTRSGVLDSVHAFSDSRLGQYFLMLILGLIALTLIVLVARYPQLKTPKQEMAVLSRETGLVLTNILLLLICVGVFFGTMFPLISEGVLGRKISLDQGFYNQVTIPLWLALAVLMGICPILNWKETDGAKFRNMLIVPTLAGILTAVALVVFGVVSVWQWMALVCFGIAGFVLAAIVQDYLRGAWAYAHNSGQNLFAAFVRFFGQRKQRYGAYTVHIGVIVMIIGITGVLFNQEVIQTVQPGEEFKLAQYSLKYSGLQPTTENGFTHVVATLEVYEGAKRQGTVTSTKTFHPTYRQPATEVGILSRIGDDIYFNLAGWEGENAHLQVSLHPLTSWIWIGSYILYLGVVVILWPRRKQAGMGETVKV